MWHFTFSWCCNDTSKIFTIFIGTLIRITKTFQSTLINFCEHELLRHLCIFQYVELRFKSRATRLTATAINTLSTVSIKQTPYIRHQNTIFFSETSTPDHNFLFSNIDNRTRFSPQLKFNRWKNDNKFKKKMKIEKSCNPLGFIFYIYFHTLFVLNIS